MASILDRKSGGLDWMSPQSVIRLETTDWGMVSPKSFSEIDSHAGRRGLFLIEFGQKRNRLIRIAGIFGRKALWKGTIKS